MQSLSHRIFVRGMLKDCGAPLYQVRSKADTKSVKDIPVLEPGGYADSKVQDGFCATSGCTVRVPGTLGLVDVRRSYQTFCVVAEQLRSVEALEQRNSIANVTIQEETPDHKRHST